jgi:hypothetical protein
VAKTNGFKVDIAQPQYTRANGSVAAYQMAEETQ